MTQLQDILLNATLEISSNELHLRREYERKEAIDMDIKRKICEALLLKMADMIRIEEMPGSTIPSDSLFDGIVQFQAEMVFCTKQQLSDFINHK